jgi:hypothetical protein
MENRDLFADILKDNLMMQAPSGLQNKIMMNIHNLEAKKQKTKDRKHILLLVASFFIPILLFFGSILIFPELGDTLVVTGSGLIGKFYQIFYITLTKIYNSILFSDNLGIICVMSALLIFTNMSAIKNKIQVKLSNK